MDKKLDSIIEFSEIGDFIDTPVQNYSSGMKVRLGFAVASQIEPDILLIDEVLAVGDISYVLKCFNKMDALLQNTTIIFVSHNIPQVARICTGLIVMKNGSAIFQSNDVSEGINLYYSMLKKPFGNYLGSDSASLDGIFLTSGGVTSEPEKEFSVTYGNALTITVQVTFSKPIENPSLYLAFYDKEQRNFCEVLNFKDAIGAIDPAKKQFTFEAYLPKIEFAQGLYSITVGMTDLTDNKRETIFRKQSAIYFLVKGKHHGWAPLQFQPDWAIKEQL
jgi:lipopolysaccharide transport system ATP-binding protein